MIITRYNNYFIVITVLMHHMGLVYIIQIMDHLWIMQIFIGLTTLTILDEALVILLSIQLFISHCYVVTLYEEMVVNNWYIQMVSSYTCNCAIYHITIGRICLYYKSSSSFVFHFILDYHNC